MDGAIASALRWHVCSRRPNALHTPHNADQCPLEYGINSWIILDERSHSPTEHSHTMRQQKCMQGNAGQRKCTKGSVSNHDDDSSQHMCSVQGTTQGTYPLVNGRCRCIWMQTKDVLAISPLVDVTGRQTLSR